MGVSAGPDIVEEGLVLHLDAGNRRSYPGTGTSFIDLSGNGYNTSIAGGATFLTGNLGSIDLNGDNQYISLGSSVNTNSNFTLEFWFKKNGVGYSGSPTIFSGISGIGYLQIRVWHEQHISFTKSMISELGNFGSDTAIDFEKTYQIAITKSGSNYQAFINGELKGILTTSESFNITGTTIGISGNPFPSNERIIANIYKFAYYNRVLTSQEVKQNFNALRGRYGI